MHASSARPLPIDANALGAAAGFVVAVASIVAVGGTRLSEAQPWIDPGRGVTGAIPSLVAGTAAGWLLGPAAARAATKRELVGIAFRLALVALVFGAVGTVLVAMPWSVDDSGAGVGAILVRLVQAVYLSAVGIAFLGWLTYPLLLLPALAWVALMRIARGW
jgi:hypothetical protein